MQCLYKTKTQSLTLNANRILKFKKEYKLCIWNNLLNLVFVSFQIHLSLRKNNKMSIPKILFWMEVNSVLSCLSRRLENYRMLEF